MKLFVITYGNPIDDTTSIELVLSPIDLPTYVKNEGGFKGTPTRDKHDGDAWKGFILSVTPAKITLDPWGEADEAEGAELISRLI